MHKIALLNGRAFCYTDDYETILLGHPDNYSYSHEPCLELLGIDHARKKAAEKL